jgi:hypothetical protein
VRWVRGVITPQAMAALLDALCATTRSTTHTPSTTHLYTEHHIGLWVLCDVGVQRVQVEALEPVQRRVGRAGERPWCWGGGGALVQRRRRRARVHTGRRTHMDTKTLSRLPTGLECGLARKQARCRCGRCKCGRPPREAVLRLPNRALATVAHLSGGSKDQLSAGADARRIARSEGVGGWCRRGMAVPRPSREKLLQGLRRSAHK